MRTLEKNWRTIYHSERVLSPSGVSRFETPVAIRCNISPLTTDWTLAEKGEVEKGMMRAILPISANNIKLGDAFYVYVDAPQDAQDILTAQGADYVVTGVEPTLNYVAIILKRMAN